MGSSPPPGKRATNVYVGTEFLLSRVKKNKIKKNHLRKIYIHKNDLENVVERLVVDGIDEESKDMFQEMVEKMLYRVSPDMEFGPGVLNVLQEGVEKHIMGLLQEAQHAADASGEGEITSEHLVQARRMREKRA
jgi:histone H3/H4